MVGEGSIGPPSAHMRSFQLWQAKSSASRISASPAARLPENLNKTPDEILAMVNGNTSKSDQEILEMVL